jgi:hypothetical protein
VVTEALLGLRRLRHRSPAYGVHLHPRLGDRARCFNCLVWWRSLATFYLNSVKGMVEVCWRAPPPADGHMHGLHYGCATLRAWRHTHVRCSRGACAPLSSRSTLAGSRHDGDRMRRGHAAVINCGANQHGRGALAGMMHAGRYGKGHCCPLPCRLWACCCKHG